MGKQTIPSSALFRLTASPPPPPPTADGGTGTGLTAEYFNNQTLSAPVVVSRVDATIDVDWGEGSPASAVSVDNFSARWTGQVEAPVTGNYTFSLISDDGVRLWVNNVLLINNWTNHGPTTDTSPGIVLTAGQKYDIKLEYYEFNSGAVLRLQWSIPGLGPQIIPKGRLYPATAASARLGSDQAESYNAEPSVHVYPIPAIDELRIDYVSKAAGDLSLRLVNTVGQSVLQLHNKVTEGQNSIRVPVRNLNRGIYILYMNQGDRQLRRKILLSE
nr:PA14 domain-containing protein [Spirosoma pollinicola]